MFDRLLSELPVILVGIITMMLVYKYTPKFDDGDKRNDFNKRW